MVFRLDSAEFVLRSNFCLQAETVFAVSPVDADAGSEGCGGVGRDMLHHHY